jgi:hypothetical protein
MKARKKGKKKRKTPGSFKPPPPSSQPSFARDHRGPRSLRTAASLQHVQKHHNIPEKNSKNAM